MNVLVRGGICGLATALLLVRGWNAMTTRARTAHGETLGANLVVDAAGRGWK